MEMQLLNCDENKYEEYWYRYEDRYYYKPEVSLVKFGVLKHTPCGVWVKRTDVFDLHGYRKRWVSKSSRKRYAYPTKEEALVSFIARKNRQLRILKCHIDDVKTVLSLANNNKEELLEGSGTVFTKSKAFWE
jgi:intein/homing endonuclease